MASNKITCRGGGGGGLNQFAVDQSAPLLLLWFTRQNDSERQNKKNAKIKTNKTQRKAKRAAGIERQVASMLNHIQEKETQ